MTYRTAGAVAGAIAMVHRAQSDINCEGKNHIFSPFELMRDLKWEKQKNDSCLFLFVHFKLNTSML